MLKKKIMDGVEYGTYVNHPQGLELLDIDLEDFVTATYANQTAELYQKIAEHRQRIEYLEMIENDLREENAILRTKLLED